MDPKYEPQARWQKKVGLISKSYKLDKKVVDAFSKACIKEEISQAKQLTIMMKDFAMKSGIEIEEEKKSEENNVSQL